MSDYWKTVEPVCDIINIYEGPEVFLSTFATVRPEAGLLYAAQLCQSEICNGGFTQFFFNSSGVLAPEAVEAFLAIGQPKVAACIQKAMDMLPSPYPRDRQVRQAALRDLQPNTTDTESAPALGGYRNVEAFGPLEHDFYGLLESENNGFEAAANKYVEKIAAS
jgi:hypothetical protein